MLSHNVIRALTAAGRNCGMLSKAILCDGATDLRLQILTQDIFQEEGVTLMTFEPGKNYFIETLTKYWVGRVESASPTEVYLAKASWVADTGLFTDFLKGGRPANLNVEPAGEVQLPIALITAVIPWPHKLFSEPIR